MYVLVIRLLTPVYESYGIGPKRTGSYRARIAVRTNTNIVQIRKLTQVDNVAYELSER